MCNQLNAIDTVNKKIIDLDYDFMVKQYLKLYKCED